MNQPENCAEALLDEELDLAAMAELVKELQVAKRVAGDNQTRIKEIRTLKRQLSHQGYELRSTQKLLRELAVEIAALKRKQQPSNAEEVPPPSRKELLLEALPPESDNARGAGLQLHPGGKGPDRTQLVNCDERMHVCHAACCRIFGISISAEEVRSGLYAWDVERPYQLEMNETGCLHLKEGSCACGVYENRPKICQNYSCKNDRRIWKDFDKMELNPNLAKKLQSMNIAEAKES